MEPEPPKPESAQAPASPEPPPLPGGKTARFRAAAQVAKVRLLQARYVCGYLAAGLLISVPIELGYQIGHEKPAAEMLGYGGLSVLYGLLLLLPFLALERPTRIPWEKMRVPEFHMFTRRVTRAAAGASLVLYLVSVVAHFTASPLAARFLPPRLFWTVLVLMVIAWGKLEVQVYLFRDFYEDKGGDKVLGGEDSSR